MKVDTSTCMKILNLLIFCKLLTELKFFGSVKIDFALIKSLPVINEIHFISNEVRHSLSNSSDHTLSNVSPLIKRAILSDKGFILRELFLRSECDINNNDLKSHAIYLS